MAVPSQSWNKQAWRVLISNFFFSSKTLGNSKEKYVWHSWIISLLLRLSILLLVAALYSLRQLSWGLCYYTALIFALLHRLSLTFGEQGCIYYSDYSIIQGKITISSQLKPVPFNHNVPQSGYSPDTIACRHGHLNYRAVRSVIKTSDGS